MAAERVASMQINHLQRLVSNSGLPTLPSAGWKWRKLLTRLAFRAVLPAQTSAGRWLKLTPVPTSEVSVSAARHKAVGRRLMSAIADTNRFVSVIAYLTH